MAINYSWNCNTVDTYPTASDSQSPSHTHTDVIYNVHWSLTGTTVHNEVSHSANIIGTQTLSTDNLSSFTDFSTITPDEITAWTTGSMIAADSGSVEAKYASVSASLALQIHPTSVVKYIE